MPEDLKAHHTTPPVSHRHLPVLPLDPPVSPNPPVDTDRRREDSGTGVRELQAR